MILKNVLGAQGNVGQRGKDGNVGKLGPSGMKGNTLKKTQSYFN